jgi:hypothetical protein
MSFQLIKLKIKLSAINSVKLVEIMLSQKKNSTNQDQVNMIHLVDLEVKTL